ncbi:membrane-spanning protein,ABC-type transport system involved in multi-copper enzyme maturation, permease component,ABC-2 family transporter protein [[Clostridium] sordellii]|uniref:ABC transporter permease n=1 Tax=Paraclostridium sordellii TaxID=1505 RepID=UPI000542EB32|nr:hypothetical protein [Paeniclostridium sordellii]CEK36221.1 membrane-spanning protein,ABC-type transport system involved in multi-copper enzyme maturation, permease component,ABC-2 family transporter protein [[Clostridium] sordellii] [Paeniclostridium sordellii]
MIKLLKLDFKRAIYNKQFIIITLIGILISMLHLWENVFQYADNYSADAYVSPFTRWMSNDCFNVYSIIFFIALPVLATVPYSDSYWIDKNSGFIKNLLTRVKKSDYFISKYITSFIIGGISVIIPLIFNLYILFMTLPSVNPTIFSKLEPIRNMIQNWYYFHPYMYILAYLFMTFMFGGVYASIGLAVSTFCKNKFFVMAIPTLAYILMFILDIIDCSQLIPVKFLTAGQINLHINMTSIIVIFIILFIISLILYWVGVNKNEVI